MESAFKKKNKWIYFAIKENIWEYTYQIKIHHDDDDSLFFFPFYKYVALVEEKTKIVK